MAVSLKKSRCPPPSTRLGGPGEGTCAAGGGGTSGRPLTPTPRAGGGAAAEIARLANSKMKLDELFLHWLSLGDSRALVLGLLDDAKQGRALKGPHQGPGGGGALSPLSPTSANVLFPSGAVPPLSPTGKAGADLESPKRQRAPQAKLAARAGPAQAIPRFFFPDGRPLTPTAAAERRAGIEAAFAAAPGGLDIEAFGKVVREVLDLPIFFSVPLFQKLQPQPSGLLDQDSFLAFWERRLVKEDQNLQVFECLRKEGQDYVTKEDLQPLLRAVLFTHPGLEFLQDTPEFQDRYAETVIYRILYNVNLSDTGKITLRELKRSNFLQATKELEELEDINQELKYFSYEHFYVIYCKFWELDTDHDFKIDREDLLRYGSHSLTYRIVDRIFEQIPRRLRCPEAGHMNYEDFVWFILSEEDKTRDQSLEYWFRCIDLVGNGVIVEHEMRHFYDEQVHRMECLSQEPVQFEDVLTQVSDMVKPEMPGAFTLKDLKRGRKMAAVFFNVLFNLNKFIAFETRDPFSVRQERSEEHLSDWDRYARTEYVRLSMEEEQEQEGDFMDVAGGVW